MEDCDQNHRENHRPSTDQRQNGEKTDKNFTSHAQQVQILIDHLQKPHRQRQEYCCQRKNRGHGTPFQDSHLIEARC